MKRTIYKDLIKWKLSKDRKPLMIYGARQVGKTYILKKFGEQEFDSFVYVNCFRNESAKTLFAESKNVGNIVLGLSAMSGVTITPGKTLVFLDEIQEIPAAVSALKYFCEDMPELHVVVAGSLLGVMNLEGESFPVGKINIMHLYPMTFSEFLLAMDKKSLYDILASRDYTTAKIVAPLFKDMLRQYYFTGGMPEAVLSFSQKKDINEVRAIQNEIIASYMSDISKHTGKEAQRIRMVWQSIPSQLAKENKKFIYGAVRKGARAADFEIAIQWLIDAGLVYKVGRVKDARIPLKFYEDPNAFKLYLVDIGLLGALAIVPPDQILIGDNVFKEYKGAFTENYVIQQLSTIPNLPVYYYSKDNSTMEIDFMVQSDDKVLPVEVKAEENTKAKSLRTFVTEDFSKYNLTGVRLSMKDYERQSWMVNVPLYFTETFFETNDDL